MDIMDKVSDITKKVSEKAGDMWEAGKISAKIHSETAETDALKQKIGEICFEKHRAGETLDPEIEVLCGEIKKHRRNIAQYQKKRQQMKQAAEESRSSADNFCAACGKSLSKGAKFCAHCGEEVE